MAIATGRLIIIWLNQKIKGQRRKTPPVQERDQVREGESSDRAHLVSREKTTSYQNFRDRVSYLPKL